MQDSSRKRRGKSAIVLTKPKGLLTRVVAELAIPGRKS